MPIIKSAKKRVKTAAKARTRNSRTKRTMRESLKAFSKAVESGKVADIQKTQTEAVSAIDMAVKKAVIHKNNGARKKAALSAKAKTAGAKVVKKAVTAKAPVAKKPVAKATPAKKPATKATVKKATPKAKA